MIKPDYLEPFSVFPDYWSTGIYKLLTIVCIGYIAFVKTKKWREGLEGSPFDLFLNKFKGIFFLSWIPDLIGGLLALGPSFLAILVFEGLFLQTKYEQSIEQLILIHEHAEMAIDAPAHKISRNQSMELLRKIHSATEPWAHPSDPTHPDDY